MRFMFSRAAILLPIAASSSIVLAQIITLQDGTPVRLRLMQTLSSADATEGQTVDFEVAEPVVGQGLVLIPKGSVALGKVTKVQKKRRFGRAGELEISVDSVRLADGSRASLRASKEKNPGPMGGARIAATVAASPVLVWVKGKEASFEKGTETAAYINGDARLDEAQLRRSLTPGASGTQAADAGAPAPAATPPSGSGAAERNSAIHSGLLRNEDIIQMSKAGLSEEVILAKIRNSSSDFKTGPQDLIRLKEAGVSDAIISMIVEKSGQR